MERAKPGDANTDWGAVDPTQKNVPGYFNLRPGPKYVDPVESARNNNWYLLTLASRRAITFLERQPEVDPQRLGVYGHSMGGNLTIYTAGTDARIKAAAPSVGGTGFRTYPWPRLPQQRKPSVNGEIDLFRATLGFQSYAPQITAPVLWLSATNDFHGVMDDMYRTGDLIPHAKLRYSVAPHLNHRFTPPFSVARVLWLDQHLQQSFQFPETPESTLRLETPNRIPTLTVKPDALLPVARVQIMYSLDPDPQARFWRTAKAVEANGNWTADLPVFSTSQPLFSFANVFYRLPKKIDASPTQRSDELALSSQLHTATPAALKAAHVEATDQRSSLIDDFSNGWRDWYQLSANNPHHWQYWTRKINDTKWRGGVKQRLTFDVKCASSNQLVVMLSENFFRPYRGRQKDYVAVVEITGGDKWCAVRLNPKDFQVVGGSASLKSWDHVDQLGLRAFYRPPNGDALVGSERWKGPQPSFRQLRWARQE